jgi:hypothetical protein
MKGVINKGIKEMLEQQYGHEQWEAVRKHAGCGDIFFSSLTDYPDHLTIRLFMSAGEILCLPVETVMIEFGKFWITETGRKTYPQIFHLAGKNARGFLLNMDRIHEQVTHGIPHAAPPRFEYDEMPDGSLAMHYFGRREMIPMLKGLVLGVGMYFNEELEVEEIPAMKENAACTVLVKFRQKA